MARVGGRVGQVTESGTVMLEVFKRTRSGLWGGMAGRVGVVVKGTRFWVME